MDAVNLLTRLKNLAHAVIYVDPPYVTANRMPYLHSEVDVAALTEALHAQVGFVAISGQNNEWDHLDWNRYEKSAVVVPRPGQKHARKRAMVEVLWTNYEAHTERSNDQLEQLSIQIIGNKTLDSAEV